MPRFVVLLRGVNVGKGNRLPMADFRALLEALVCCAELFSTYIDAGSKAVQGMRSVSVLRRGPVIGPRSPLSSTRPVAVLRATLLSSTKPSFVGRFAAEECLAVPRDQARQA